MSTFYSRREQDKTTGHARVVGLGAALGVAVALALAVIPTAGGVRPGRPAIAAAPAPALDRFILNALLAPALDADAIPLRWTDPRPTSQCGPETAVRVNGEPLLAGALVPDTPFELEWQADGCRPFGAHGPRLDGRVQLSVFREDWGFSATIKPSGLRLELAENAATLVHPGAASLPQCVEASESYELTIGGDRSLPCR